MSPKIFRIFIVLVIIFSLGIGGYFVFKKKSVPLTQQTLKDETADWKTYSNNQYGFAFQYPSDWILKEASSEEIDYSGIVSLRSPETEEFFRDGKINPGYLYNLVVSFWPNINNEAARGGSWLWQRNYTNLVDYFTDKNAPKQQTGEITIAGQKAYEVSIGGYGLNYGVMIEHNGIYELAFLTAWDKSQLGVIEKQILSTLKFIQKVPRPQSPTSVQQQGTSSKGAIGGSLIQLQASGTSSVIVSPITQWITYRNQSCNFEVKYPPAYVQDRVQGNCASMNDPLWDHNALAVVNQSNCAYPFQNAPGCQVHDVLVQRNKIEIEGAGVTQDQITLGDIVWEKTTMKEENLMQMYFQVLRNSLWYSYVFSFHPADKVIAEKTIKYILTTFRFL